MSKRLTAKQEDRLMEALRRYTRFHQGEPLTQAWTGLGSMTTYKSVLDAELMTYATPPNPGYKTWWRLTDAGAAIVQAWLDQGITHETVERGRHSLA